MFLSLFLPLQLPLSAAQNLYSSSSSVSVCCVACAGVGQLESVGVDINVPSTLAQRFMGAAFTSVIEAGFTITNCPEVLGCVGDALTTLPCHDLPLDFILTSSISLSVSIER